MKTLEVFACQANRDTTEGRGPMFDVIYTSSEEVARQIVNHPIFYGQYGVQGVAPYKNGEYDVIKKSLVVVDSLADYLKVIKNEKALAAMKKLTKEERVLLGLEKE